MPATIFNLFPNLEPFNYEVHFESMFLNQQWVLVNGIKNKKAIYIFKDETNLSIFENDKSIETTWSIDVKNTFTIETEDGKITVEAFFKDDDILVLNKEKTGDCAVFINESSYSEELNSIEDVQHFLREKYKQKATNLIYGHEFYYIERSQEFGPITVEELAEKVKNDSISAYCFVRDVNEYDYSKRLRIIDLIREL
jgi:hypothetical protein